MSHCGRKDKHDGIRENSDRFLVRKLLAGLGRFVTKVNQFASLVAAGMPLEECGVEDSKQANLDMCTKFLATIDLCLEAKVPGVGGDVLLCQDRL